MGFLAPCLAMAASFLGGDPAVTDQAAKDERLSKNFMNNFKKMGGLKLKDIDDAIKQIQLSDKLAQNQNLHMHLDRVPLINTAYSSFMTAARSASEDPSDV